MTGRYEKRFPDRSTTRRVSGAKQRKRFTGIRNGTKSWTTRTSPSTGGLRAVSSVLLQRAWIAMSRRRADQTALIYDSPSPARFTYRVARRSRKFAGVLKNLGVGKGDT